MPVAAGFREILAECFEQTAWWREQKGDEYAGDPRNANSAESLRLLAEVVREDFIDEDRIIARLSEERCDGARMYQCGWKTRATQFRGSASAAKERHRAVSVTRS
jgi:hypothetical protein